MPDEFVRRMVMPMNEEQLTASYLVLLLGKLTGWNYPAGDFGGDPVYLTAEQKTALAAEGVRLLTSYLPSDAAKQVASAIERLPRPQRMRQDGINYEATLMRIGALGGVLPSVRAPNGAPGGCLVENGQLVCASG
jgi:hypothetical protein